MISRSLIRHKKQAQKAKDLPEYELACSFKEGILNLKAHLHTNKNIGHSKGKKTVIKKSSILMSKAQEGSSIATMPDTYKRQDFSGDLNVFKPKRCKSKKKKLKLPEEFENLLKDKNPADVMSRIHIEKQEKKHRKRMHPNLKIFIGSPAFNHIKDVRLWLIVRSRIYEELYQKGNLSQDAFS